MKKKKVIYLLLFLFLFLGFHKEVYAAQELTCLYEKKGAKNSHNGDISKVLLVQDKNGKKAVYKNDHEANFESYNTYWSKVLNISSYKYRESSSKESNKLEDVELTKCPESKTTGKLTNKLGTGNVEFFGSSDGEDQLEDHVNKVIDFLDFNKGSSDSNSDSGIDKDCDSISNDKKWQTASLDNSKYIGSCLYQGRTEYGCHIIELNMSKQGIQVIDSFDGKRIGSSASGGKYTMNRLSDANNNTLTPKNIESSAKSNGCPPYLNVDIHYENYGQGENVYIGDVSFGLSGQIYNFIDARGENMFTGEKLTSDVKIDLQFNRIKIVTCEELFENSEDLLEKIKIFITIIKIIIPVILLALGTLDFARAVFASNEDGIKKSQSRFIKRLIIAVVIFLIPSFLKLILTLANQAWDNIDPSLCGIL